MLNYISCQEKNIKLSTDELIPMLKALAEPTRLSIFNLLMQGVQCNCEIAEQLGQSLSLISHHMRILQRSGLVQSERDSTDTRWIYYSIERDKLTLLNQTLNALLDAQRIQERTPTCGPRACQECNL